jgi:hypothetical protein
VSHETAPDIRIPIRHTPGEASGLGPGAVYPTRMDITLRPRAKQVVVTEEWYVRLETTKGHVYGNTLSPRDIRDEAVINNYFPRFRDAAVNLWNGKLQLIATQHGHAPVNYDLVFRIERSMDPGSYHWSVLLHLYNKDYLPGHDGDSANWYTGVIELHLNSAVLRHITHGTTQTQTHRGILTKAPVNIRASQMPVAHEFGHTVGNSVGLSMHADEYYRPEYSQEQLRREIYRSIMNIGNQIEAKHADYIVNQLNQYYDTLRHNSVRFSAGKVPARPRH